MSKTKKELEYQITLRNIILIMALLIVGILTIGYNKIVNERDSLEYENVMFLFELQEIANENGCKSLNKQELINCFKKNNNNLVDISDGLRFYYDFEQ